MLISCSSDSVESTPSPKERPNIVYILADDLGYGDVSGYNAESKIQTPNIDRLINEGMKFTDAHSPSSVCTPTRYGILTGQYCWRSKLPVGVLGGYGQAFMDSSLVTVGELLQSEGYHTSVIGKWHLGLDWQVKSEFRDSVSTAASINELGIRKNMKGDWVDFNVPPVNGPLAHGFDYSFILPASLDMEPYCYLRNDTLVDIPTASTPGNDLNTGYTGAFWRPGRMAPGFAFDQVLPSFINEAIHQIEKQVEEDQPFFLYLPLAAPHTPWVPTAEFVGQSKAGQYGDFVQMVDAAVGQILDLLDESGVTDETLLVFTSDNGPYWRPNMIEQFDHRAAGSLRGMKADIFEGGHRIPFVVRWPGKIVPGSECNHPTVLTNLLATCADMLGVKLKDHLDSESILPDLLQERSGEDLNVLVHHSGQGMFAIRSGDWKYVEGLGSGGFTQPARSEPEAGGPTGQLYNLEQDPGEQQNLFIEYREEAQTMSAMLDNVRAE